MDGDITAGGEKDGGITVEGEKDNGTMVEEKYGWRVASQKERKCHQCKRGIWMMILFATTMMGSRN
jgi:hypothetical protein